MAALGHLLLMAVFDNKTDELFKNHDFLFVNVALQSQQLP